jgi:hypothetical protein
VYGAAAIGAAATAIPFLAIWFVQRRRLDAVAAARI